MRVNIIISTILILAASSLFAPAHAQLLMPVAKEAAFGNNERLTFVVSYRAALVPNIEAGEVTIKTSETMMGTTPVYNIYGNGKVFSHFKWFYDLNDTYQTWLDKSTLKPVKFDFKLREGKYQVNCNYIYNWAAKEVTTAFHNLKRTPDSPKTMPLSNKSFDAVALFYNLRSDDISTYIVGERRYMDLVLEDTIRKISYKYMGKEKKTIRKLGTFNTIKFSCTLATSSGESFQDGSEFYLWMTDDKNKMPLYIESPIKIGSIRGILTKYSGLKYPLDAKIK